jgi:hypothetical protein
MPPDLAGDCNTDGYVNVKDSAIIGRAFGSKPGDSNWDPRADLNNDGYVNVKDATIVGANFGKVEAMPVAYSTTFDFTVPDDGNNEVYYYVLARVYVPSGLSGQAFYFVAGADERVQNVKLDSSSKSGNGSSVNINLGTLSSGYHLIEFEFFESSGSGWLNFHVATAASNYAWLVRFRIYVPNYSNNEYRYTVKTSTILPIDDHYFLKGYADDFIDDLYLDGLYWQDWEWDMGPTYGVINAWGDGFLYPMGYRQKEPLDVTFTFGEKEGAGLLDFQFISWTSQQSRISNPIFWTKASAEEATSYLKIYEAKAWTGSKWTAEPGRSMRLISTTLRVLVNTTDPSTFHPAPQEAEVSLVLGWLDPAPKRNVVQDIGVMINLTYTYFIDGSVVYGMPIWFDAQSIEVRLAEQGSALYMPYPSIVFNTQSNNSFISPQWKVVGTASGMLINWFITSALYDTFGPAGAIAGISSAAFISQLYNFFNNQELVSVQENPGNSTYRKFAYTDWFKTAESQQPLAKPVRSLCQGFFFRVYPFASGHCGLISINLKGNLYLPFFYVNPQYEYGTWLPVHVELQTAFPVFITD